MEIRTPPSVPLSFSSSSPSSVSPSSSSSSSSLTPSLLTSLYQSLHLPKPKHHHIICLGNQDTNLVSIRNIFDNLSNDTNPSSSSTTTTTTATNGYSSLSQNTHYISYSYQTYEAVYPKAVEYEYVGTEQYRSNGSLLSSNSIDNNNRIHFYGIHTSTCPVLQLVSTVEKCVKNTTNNNHHHHAGIHSFTIMLVIDCTNPFTVPEQLNSLTAYRNELLPLLLSVTDNPSPSLPASSAYVTTDPTTITNNDTSITCMYILSTSEQLIDDGSLAIFNHQLKSSNTLTVSLISYLLNNPCRVFGTSTFSAYLYWYVRSRAFLDNVSHPTLKNKIGFACLPLDTSLPIYQSFGYKVLTYISTLGIGTMGLSNALNTGNGGNTSVTTRDTTFMMLDQDTYDNVYQYFTNHIRPWISTHLPTDADEPKNYFTDHEKNEYTTYYQTLYENRTDQYSDAKLWYTCLSTFYVKSVTLSLYNQSKLVLLGGNNTTPTNRSSFENIFSVYWWNTLIANHYHQSSTKNHGPYGIDYRSKILSLGAFTMFLLTGIHPHKSTTVTGNANSGSNRLSIGPSAFRTTIVPSMNTSTSRMSIIHPSNTSSSVASTTPVSVPVLSRVSIAPSGLGIPSSSSSTASRQSIGGTASTNLNTVIPRVSLAPSSVGVIHNNQTTIIVMKETMPDANTVSSSSSRTSVMINNTTTGSGNLTVSALVPTSTFTGNTSNTNAGTNTAVPATKPPTAVRTTTRTVLTKTTNKDNGTTTGEKDPSKYFKALLEKPTVSTKGVAGTTGNGATANGNSSTTEKNL